MCAQCHLIPPPPIVYFPSKPKQAALTATLLPKIEMVAGEDPEDEPDYEIDDDPSVSVPLDTRYVPLTLTVSQVGVTPALDLDLLEEASAAAALSVGVDAEGRVVGTTQRGAGGISPETLLVRHQKFFFLGGGAGGREWGAVLLPGTSSGSWCPG